MTTLMLPTMRQDQWAIVSHPARTKIVAMGRRWGKSTMAGAVSLATASQGAAVAWVVPTYKNGRPLWRWTEAAVGELRKAKQVEVNRSERTVSFPHSRGIVGIYSADNPTSILGEAFDLVVIDEAARIDEQVWFETLQPTLADRDGRAIIISTPKGRNWFWREYQRARQDGKEAAAFNAPSSANPNPHIQKAAERAKESVPDRTYRQEWLAEFIETEGAVFRNVQACVQDCWRDEPEPGHSYVFGIDIGRTNDYTVVAVLDTTTRQIVNIDRYTGVSFAVQQERVKAMYERWQPDLMIVELNNFGFPFVEALVAAGLPVRPFRTTNQTKQHIVDSLVFAVENQAIGLPDVQVLRDEFLAYEQTQLPSGLIRYSAPEGQHDDIVMATAFAWYGGRE